MFGQTSIVWRPFLPLGVLLLWLAAGVFFAAWEWRRFARTVRRSYRTTLLGCRCLGLLLLLLFLMRPVVVRLRPERDGFRVAVLADRSRSMERTDPDGTVSRRARLDGLLGSPAMRRLAASAEVERWEFSEEARPAPYSSGGVRGSSGPLPGDTRLGEAMAQAAEGRLGAKPLGAMLVFSDGHWNGGVSPVETAKLLARRGLPVSCVGIGAEGDPEDVAVRFAEGTPRTAGRNQAYQVPAIVRNDFPREQDVEVSLLENGQPAARRRIRVPPRSERRVVFEHRSLLAGMRSLSVRASLPEGDRKPEDDVDFWPVRIREEDRFRILYLGSALHWEWRFLRINAEKNRQLVLSAIVRTAEGQFFRYGLNEKKGAEADEAGKAGNAGGKAADAPQGFPRDTRGYADFDAVLADAESLWLMSPDARSALAAFVEHKGGGLLITGGDPRRRPLLPEPFPKLSPAARVEESVSPSDRLLAVVDPLVFRGEAGGGGLLASGRIPLRGGVPVLACASPKRAARTLLRIQDGPAVMAAQSYGAGRCVYLGLEQTWRWRMQEQDGAALHERFWNRLLVWLASCQTPQLEILGQDRKVPVDVLHELRIRVAGPDFLPAPAASVRVRITDPARRSAELTLEPALDRVGLYQASFLPTMPGLYELRYQVRLPEEDRPREAAAALLATLSGPETRDTRYREEILRDIARITGGKFLPARDFPRNRLDLPLSRRLPATRTETPLLASWWTLLALAAALLAHWWMRRRIGLK